MKHLPIHLVLAMAATVSASAKPTVTETVELMPLEDKSGWTPFVVPVLATDATAGTPIDLSFLNPVPAGTHGFLRAEGEKIVDGRGEEVRLFGTNICDFHVTPPAELAAPIARRLKQLGINFVRLHYADFGTAENGGLMKPDMKTLDPEALDRMDRLVHELIQHGVYVDLNLHVARGYPGLPSWWMNMGKGLDRVAEPFIDDQKSFARQLLTHVNPHTGNAYADEPGIAAVELNNENSARLPWPNVNRTLYGQLPAELGEPIRADWNRWLAERYPDADALRAAWTPEGVEPGPELLRNAEFANRAGGLPGWELEDSNGGEAEAEIVRGDAKNLLRWEVTKEANRDFGHQFHQRDLAVEADTSYVLKLRLRSSTSNQLKVSLMQDGGGYATLLGPVVLDLTPEWATHTLGGVLGDPDGAPVRLSLDALNRLGAFEVAGVSLRTGAVDPLANGGDPQAGTVQLPGAATTPQVMRDFTDWVSDKDIAYAERMTRFLREDLGVKSLVWDTQVDWGGGFGVYRESLHSDVMDNHGYPFHPEGTRDANGTWTWFVTPGSLVGEGFEGGLSGLAASRLAGKPYFISEYDVNPPNDHAAESWPLLSLLSAYQGWAGFGEYAWLNWEPNYEFTRIRSAFSTAGHAGQLATIPTSALAFRQGRVAPAEETTTLTVHEETLRHAGDDFDAIRRIWAEEGVEPATAWTRRMELNVLPGEGPTSVENAPGASGSTLVSDTGEIRVERVSPGGAAESMHVAAPAFRAFVGTASGEPVELGDLTLTVRPTTRNAYAHVYTVTLDNLPLAESERVLVTTLARVENKGQRYNRERTSVGPDWGEGPTLAEPVEAELKLPTGGWSATALQGDGTRGEAVEMGDGGSVLDTADRPGVWFLLERE